MPKASRKGDIGSGHGCFPPSNAIEGSGDVFIGDLSWGGKESLPVKAKLRFILSQIPGNPDHAYTEEPYKLYKDGALMQEGTTDHEGIITYEYEPPLIGELMVESAHGHYQMPLQPLAPAETTDGVKQRLSALGHYDMGEKDNAIRAAQCTLDSAASGEINEALINFVKSTMP